MAGTAQFLLVLPRLAYHCLQCAHLQSYCVYLYNHRPCAAQAQLACGIAVLPLFQRRATYTRRRGGGGTTQRRTATAAARSAPSASERAAAGTAGARAGCVRPCVRGASGGGAAVSRARTHYSRARAVRGRYARREYVRSGAPIQLELLSLERRGPLYDHGLSAVTCTTRARWRQ